MHATGASAEDIRQYGRDIRGATLKGQKAAQGLALSNLEPGLFDKVIQGDLLAERGAIIGEGVKEHEDQRALASMLADREKSGRRVTNDQLSEMIRLTNEAPKQTETQDSLFGSAEMTRSLIPEKAEVSDYVRSRLGREKRLFQTVGTEGAAAQLGETGNVIRADVNRERAGDTGAALAIYDKLSASAGPVADALDRAATALANGENGNAVKERSYGEIRQQLIEQARRLQGGSATPAVVGSAGAAELGTAGPRETGEGQHADDAENAVERRAGERGSFSGRDVGPHGPIFPEFHHDAPGAIAKLRELQSGDAVGALHHPEVGDIDLIWGKPGTRALDYDDGYGLSHILAKGRAGAPTLGKATSYRKSPHKRQKPQPFGWGFSYTGQLPTLPHTCACSTIGAEGLNCRVRDGNGWVPLAMVTQNLF